MKKIFLFFFLFNVSLLFGQCPHVDSSLKTYVDDFIQVSTYYQIDFSRYYNLEGIYYFSKILQNDSLVGLYLPDQQIIYIRNENKDPRYIRLVVFHELGHAVLGKEHDDSKLSVMNSKLEYDRLEEYIENWDQLMLDLFNKVEPENHNKEECK